MVKFLYNKLVRDRVVDQLESQGVRVTQRALSSSEYVLALKKKLVEEANEVLDASDPDELAREMADVHEVLAALGTAAGLPEHKVRAARAAKREDRGGFAKPAEVLCIRVPDDRESPQLEELLRYLRGQPDRYPETAEEEQGR